MIRPKAKTMKARSQKNQHVSTATFVRFKDATMNARNQFGVNAPVIASSIGRDVKGCARAMATGSLRTANGEVPTINGGVPTAKAGVLPVRSGVHATIRGVTTGIGDVAAANGRSPSAVVGVPAGKHRAVASHGGVSPERCRAFVQTNKGENQ